MRKLSSKYIYVLLPHTIKSYGLNFKSLYIKDGGCPQLLAVGSRLASIRLAVLWSTQLWSLFAASQQLLAQNS